MTKLKKNVRHRHILTSLAANAGMSVSDLSNQLAVSKQTIRRDLDELSERGEISRTYGGASAPAVGIEPNLAERGQTLLAERTQIADLACELFKERDTIMIGGGITAMFCAQAFARSFQRLQIVTNSISVATVMAKSGSHRVILAPGDYDPMEGCVVGAETQAFIDKFRADVAVIGASGLDREGIYEVHTGISWVDRAMLRRSHRGMVVVTDNKMGHSHLEHICPLSSLDMVVTNARPPIEIQKALYDSGVEVHFPKPASE